MSVLRCSHCKHFGATVPCKASDRVYHWPCAVASGAFLEKSTLVMVSVESYDKVGLKIFSSWDILALFRKCVGNI